MLELDFLDRKREWRSFAKLTMSVAIDVWLFETRGDSGSSGGCGCGGGGCGGGSCSCSSCCGCVLGIFHVGRCGRRLLSHPENPRGVPLRTLPEEQIHGQHDAPGGRQSGGVRAAKVGARAGQHDIDVEVDDVGHERPSRLVQPRPLGVRDRQPDQGQNKAGKYAVGKHKGLGTALVEGGPESRAISDACGHVEARHVRRQGHFRMADSHGVVSMISRLSGNGGR